MARVDVTRDFALPVERLYAYLSEHENLGPLFGARIERVRDGDTSRNGEGSVRRLRVPPLPAFEETVTRAVPDELVEYRITKGPTPLRDHRGVMRFSSTPGGSRLHYVIEFGAVLPLLDRVLAAVLERNVRKGLAQVEGKA
jgi:uncharacterized protein YndB with AHSA1/START domain